MLSYAAKLGHGVLDKALLCGMQSKETLACLTPDCAGVLISAVVLGGHDGAHKELYSHVLPNKPILKQQPKAIAPKPVPGRKGQRILDAGEAPMPPLFWCLKPAFAILGALPSNISLLLAHVNSVTKRSGSYFSVILQL